MSITWTKKFVSGDDGLVLTGAQLGQVQDDVSSQVIVLSSLTGVFSVTIDGGGDAIATGKKAWLVMPFACTLNNWTIAANASGAIVIDINRSTYANFASTVSITNGHEPTITASAQKAQDTDLSDWTSVAIVAGDVIEFEVDSCTTISRCTLAVKYTRS